MSEAIAVLSQKGGTGKTTMVRSLADVFDRLGIDVLAVDADPQGNLSDYFDTAADAHPTLGEVLQGQARAADAIHGRVIPANLRLAEAELMLAGKIVDRQHRADEGGCQPDRGRPERLRREGMTAEGAGDTGPACRITRGRFAGTGGGPDR